MNRFFFKYLFFLLTLGLIYTSCVKKTNYSKIPQIEYKDFFPFQGDSADLVIKFTDGDGDIGVSKSDSTKTLFITYYYKDTITQLYRAFYSPNINDTLRTTYIVREPETQYIGQPISGEISARLQQYRHSKKIKKIKYVVQLFDKSGNQSNKLSSPEISVP